MDQSGPADRARLAARPHRRQGRLGAHPQGRRLHRRQRPGTDQDRWENQDGFPAGDDRGRDRRPDLRGRHRAQATATRPSAPRPTSAKADDLAAHRRPLDRDRATAPTRPRPTTCALTKDGKPDKGTITRSGTRARRRSTSARSSTPPLPRPRPARRQAPQRPDGAQLPLRRRRQARRPAPSGTASASTATASSATAAPWRLFPDDSARRSGGRGRSSPASAASTNCSLAVRRPPICRPWPTPANDGLMLPEQVWDGRPRLAIGFTSGRGNLSATPLAWTHAQFVRLAWSIEAGTPVERPKIVADRYASATAKRYSSSPTSRRSGVFVCSPAHPRTHDSRRRCPWPAETSVSLPPSPARTASAGTTKRRSPSATTRIASPCGTTASGAGDIPGIPRRVKGRP